MRVAPPRTRAEVPWTPPYRYQCTKDHTILADQPVAKCPAYVHGQPCTGQLTPFTRRHAHA